MKPRLFVLWLILLVGCAPQSPPQLPPGPPPGAVPPPPGPVPPGPEPKGPPPPIPVRPFDESILKGREYLFETGFSNLVWVRDPDLGNLGTDPAMILAVEGFLQGAAGEGLSPKTLVSRWADYLQRWAKKAKAEGLEISSVRIGEPRVEPRGGWMIPVKVSGQTKEWQGWVYLVREDEILLVSDIQLVETSPPTQPYDPETPLEVPLVRNP